MDVPFSPADLVSAILVAVRTVAAVLGVVPAIVPVLVVAVTSVVVTECAERAAATVGRVRPPALSRAR